MSMSAYIKAPTAHNLHNHGRTYPDSLYPYATPMYPSQSLGPPLALSEYSNLAQPSQLASYQLNEARSSYDEGTGSYLNLGGLSPQLTSFSPSKGPEYSKVQLNFITFSEIMTGNFPKFFLTFGSSKRQAVAHRPSQKDSVYLYTVFADVPPFISTGWHSSKVPVSMTIESSSGGVVISKMIVGEFEYTDQQVHSSSDNRGNYSYSPDLGISYKRKDSDDSSQSINSSPRKRSLSSQLQCKEEFANYNASQVDTSSSYSYMPASNIYGPLTSSYSGIRQPMGFQGQSSRPSHYGYPSSETGASPTLRAQSPQTGNWGSFHSLNSNLSRSPGLSSNSTANHTSISSSPLLPANPPLFRTSTFHHTPSPEITPHIGNSKQFNAYSLYPHKAKLEIIGDLDSMAKNWSEEEMNSRRRLVVFTRSQNGSTIITSFYPIGFDDRAKDSICISCIYWEEKNECFVTSVDAIYLLQKLVAAQFTVEEKNRIRRNLEGFRPMTVSKGKSESEEFFKIIMAFPSPKPRNIEKDVKVFFWNDLSSALKKIIGKYSASPSSTVPQTPTILTPISSNGYSTDSSSDNFPYSNDYNRSISPHSFSSSGTITGPSTHRLSPPNIDKSSMSIPMPLRTSKEIDVPDLRIPVLHDATSTLQNHYQPGQIYSRPRQIY